MRYLYIPTERVKIKNQQYNCRKDAEKLELLSLMVEM